MSDFLTDSDDEKAVEDLLSQAMDSIVLDQVAAINCSGFNDSGLPSHLETRFKKLKSFPVSKPTDFPAKSFDVSNLEPKKSGSDEKLGEEKESEKAFSTCSKKCPKEKILSSPLNESENGILSPVMKNPSRKLGKKEPKSPSLSSLESFSSRSVSPPVKKTGCFLCSPKKVLSKKKSTKENRADYASDSSDFSSHLKIMKKAAKEEEKICREAEKIVKWAKQASARMDVKFEDELISDDEINAKFT